MSQLASYGLTYAEGVTVYPTPDQPAKRMLMAIAHDHPAIATPQSTQLIIEQQRHQYTADYCQLLAEFLLCC